MRLLQRDSTARTPFPGLLRQWAIEEAEADSARTLNEFLQACARTRFRVGDIVLLDHREAVEVLEVFPPGYVSVPRKHNLWGRLAEPVTSGQTLYRYRRLSDPPRSGCGQTTEDRLSPRTQGLSA